MEAIDSFTGNTGDRLGYQNSEIDLRGAGSAGWNFAFANTSSQRLHMDASHLKQRLTLVDGDYKRWFTGIERNYGKQAHMVKFDTGCVRVINTIARHSGLIPKGMTPPETLIVYEREDNHQIDVIQMRSIHFQHQKFGFPLEQTKVAKGVMRHAAFAKDTILALPPTITPEFDVKIGKEATVYFSNNKAGIEDGAWISDELAYAMRTKAYGKLEMTFSKTDIPLNVNGDENNFKPIPDIGDYLRKDGLVMASRPFRRDYPMSLFNKNDLMRHSHLDNLRYGEIPNEVRFKLEEGEELLIQPRVIDIEVLKGVGNRSPITMAERQLEEYWKRTLRFHESVIRTHEELERTIPGYELSPAWQRWVDSAYFYVNEPQGSRNEVYKREPIPHWRVIVTYEYTFIPTVGTKFTNLHAGKTVVVKKTPRALMPRDKDGNIADFVIEGNSAINRMNPGVIFELRLGSCELATRKRIKKMYETGVDIDTIYEYYAGFMKIVSPMTYHNVMDPKIDRKLAIAEIIEGGITAKIPPSLGPLMIEILKELTEKYPPCRDKMYLTNNDGEVVETSSPSEIGTLCLLLLERTGDTFSAVNSGCRQHHGIATKASKKDRDSFPVKISATRFPGEADTKSVQSALNNEGIPEMIDRSLNPISHRLLCRSLIRSEDPSNIVDAVPRDVFPRKGNRVTAIRDNYMFVGGMRLVEGADGNLVLPEDPGYGMGENNHNGFCEDDGE